MRRAHQSNERITGGESPSCRREGKYCRTYLVIPIDIKLKWMVVFFRVNRPEEPIYAQKNDLDQLVGMKDTRYKVYGKE